MRRFLPLLLLLLPGCAALAPRPVPVEARLAALPIAAPVASPVTIRWNDRLVPWLEAERDEDLFFALGLVHGHLRHAQVALLRMVSQGRLSEMAGPFTTDIDHALRALGFGRVAPAIIAGWPPETRRLMERFRDGLNHAVAHTRPPPEFALLGLRPEPFTLEELLAIGRLAGTDVNWLSWFALLPERGTPGFRAAWARVLEAGSGQVPLDGPLGFLGGMSRAGSNTVAVGPARSASGAALLANDPHLGLNLPNLWLIVGMRSPSFHAVGAMVPGLPFLGFGRNPDLAWGGTNLRAASSDLFDVSALPPGSFRTERGVIRRRLWPDAAREWRVTDLGPVVTDAPAVPGGTLALRWAGHLPTDEITALLHGARARDGATFRAAFDRFGVSAQNMVWAERGAIGRFTAATLPRRAGFPADGPVLPPGAAATWDRPWTAPDLPSAVNPPDAILASGNENPRLWAPDAPVLGAFFSDGDRVARLRQFVAERGRVTARDLMDLQRDTRSPKARDLAAALVARYGDALPPALAPLRGWDGDYRADSRAPLIFEALLAPLVRATLPEGRGGGARGPETGWNFITTFLLRDLDALPAPRRAQALRDAAEEAARTAAPFADWGSAHRLRAAHWLVNLPLVGGRFVFADFPAGGSRETPMKTSHGPVAGRHNVTFGSMARHVSDMADPDANWFSLWGGQDGWLGSASFMDQVEDWQEGRMIRLPLRPATVAAEFPRVTVLRPAR